MKKEIEYLSNPCRWDWNKKGFTYEGGTILFHFCPSNCIKHKDFENYIPLNVLFFANNEEHAKDIIERMLRFRLTQSTDSSRPKAAQLILDHKDEWVVNSVPNNQFYKVGWTCNDTIL